MQKVLILRTANDIRADIFRPVIKAAGLISGLRFTEAVEYRLLKLLNAVKLSGHI